MNFSLNLKIYLNFILNFVLSFTSMKPVKDCLMFNLFNMKIKSI